MKPKNKVDKKQVLRKTASTKVLCLNKAREQIALTWVDLLPTGKSAPIPKPIRGNNIFRNLKNFVYATDGSPALLSKDQLEKLYRDKIVITKDAWANRKLVDCVTGEFTELDGEDLEQAMQEKKVISRKSWVNKNLYSNFVDSTTGQPTSLTGEELMDARQKKLVTYKVNFLRKYNLVYRDSGLPVSTVITQNELQALRASKVIMTSGAWRAENKNLIDIQTGKKPTFTGKNLIQAKAEGRIITYGNWWNRKNKKQESISTDNKNLNAKMNRNSFFASKTETILMPDKFDQQTMSVSLQNTAIENGISDHEWEQILQDNTCPAQRHSF
jgi:hypothetical protein